MLRPFQGIKGNSHSLSTITQRKIDLKAKKADLHFNFKSMNPASNGLQWAWGGWEYRAETVCEKQLDVIFSKERKYK